MTIDFSAPSSGASATLSASSAVTDASGLASVTATANATAGNYAVTASATGVTSSASFNLTNQIQPSFSGLTDQTVTYGSTVTFTGTLAAGLQVPGWGRRRRHGRRCHARRPDRLQRFVFDPIHSFGRGAERELDWPTTSPTTTRRDGVFLAAEGSSQLTVTRGPLTITANNQTKVYGAALPTLTASYSGFVNGDTSASLTTQPTLTTTATASSHVAGSPYTITASGAVDSDYSISYVAGSLTVTAAPLTITAEQPDQGLRRGAADADRQLLRLRQWRHLGQPDHAAHADDDGHRQQPRRGQPLQHHRQRRGRFGLQRSATWPGP